GAWPDTVSPVNSGLAAGTTWRAGERRVIPTAHVKAARFAHSGGVAAHAGPRTRSARRVRPLDLVDTTNAGAAIWRSVSELAARHIRGAHWIGRVRTVAGWAIMCA